MKLAQKLIGGFLFAALITVAVGVQDNVGLNSMEEDLIYLSEVEIPAVQTALTLKVDIQRIRALTHLIMSQVISTEERKEEHHQVELVREEMFAMLEKFKSMAGKSEEEQQLVRDYEETLSAWRTGNNKVLKISEELIALDISSPDRLASDMRHLAAKHHELLSKVGQLMTAGHAFDGGTDAATCPLGKWLETFSTHNKELNALIERLRPVHHELHQSVAKIKEASAAGLTFEARTEYQDRTLPLAKQVFSIFDEMLQIAAAAQDQFAAIKDIFDKEILPAQREALGRVDKLVEVNLESSRHHQEMAHHNAQSVKMRSGIMAALGTLIAMGMGIVLSRSITRPMVKGVALAEAMSRGDLSQTLDIRQKDEIGQLGRALNEMITSLRTMLGAVTGEVTSISGSSSALAGIATQMTSGVNDTAKRMGMLSQASEEMASNQQSVAAAMEQAATNVNTVAAASEEMSATISEIATNTSKAKNITDQAVTQSQSASARVNELGKAASEISKVTETITAISSQTNLLALNATIEAARAGEAGRGFAVVANEIKELAQQTAQATEEIRSRIQGIQDATGVTVQEITQISGVISDVDAIVATIATAVEEQSVTTREIAENIGQASMGIAEVNEKVAADADATAQITEEIANVNSATNEMRTSSDQVQMSAADLASTAQKLKELVARFKLQA